MIIKKFSAKTEEEAVVQAKAELGGNIVIMNVKTIPGKGLFGFLKKPQTEVTVAKEEENERYPGGGAQNKAAEEANLRETFRQVAKAAGMEKGVREPLGEKEKFSHAGGIDIKADDRAVPRRREEAADENHKLLVEKLDSLQNMIEKKLQSEEEAASETPMEETEENNEMVRFLKLLYDTMLDNEVNEKYANQIIDEMEKNVRENQPFDHALADVYQKMILKFGKAVPIEKDNKGLRVIFFVGPTGVGKTTTIAKIASKFRLEQKRKVALFTADTYRIAAAEQLRTYANILEVPFRVIYSVEELRRGVQDFKNYDFILVDMAGHSPQNPALRENMNTFIHGLEEGIEKEVHLVLSATTKYKDLLSIVESYQDIEDYRIIFTKVDETMTLGNLLNLKLHTGAGLSYITCGQNVPDDIEIFNPQKTVKQLLGGKN
ncbi:MAG: flagellar biosynthesis protein FlhF [Lachnospiraceae bacterium]|jgi:flagellar biosynthesis protein FlhF|nr:flagellar biosynthesis protein FlhF [Lachnospiraceae bacterium]